MDRDQLRIERKIKGFQQRYLHHKQLKDQMALKEKELRQLGPVLRRKLDDSFAAANQQYLSYILGSSGVAFLALRSIVVPVVLGTAAYCYLVNRELKQQLSTINPETTTSNYP